METRVLKAIDILLDALNNGTLKHGDCTACAVGNLVRAGMGLTKEEYNVDTLKTAYEIGFINWSALFCTTGCNHDVARNPKDIMEKFPYIKEQIDSTDFTLKELSIIENTFEYGFRKYHFKGSDLTRRLAAVIEVMKSFHPEENLDMDVQKCFNDRVTIIDPEISL